MFILVGAAAWFWKDARQQADEARRQAERAELNLNLATKTAKSLALDLAQKLGNGTAAGHRQGHPGSGAGAEEQLLKAGQSTPDLRYGQASALAMQAEALVDLGDAKGGLAIVQQARKITAKGRISFRTTGNGVRVLPSRTRRLETL